MRYPPQVRPHQSCPGAPVPVPENAIALSVRGIAKTMRWGTFPRHMRRRYLAQRGRCPYCGHPLSLGAKGDDVATRDHVQPRSRGGGGQTDNLVLAHIRCNRVKGSRMPRPCERLYAWAAALALLDGWVRADWRIGR
jgi:5-methylcytosine-specific restriction endonuclease McrA